MSLVEVETAIRQWEENDELAQSPGFCRRSAKKMLEVASSADVSNPHAKAEVVVWPKPMESEGVHYALRVTSIDGDIIFNPCPAAQFPQYNGNVSNAPGLLQEMKSAEEIK